MRLTSKQYDIKKNVARNYHVATKRMQTTLIYLLHYVIIALSTKDTLLFLLKNV